MSAFPEDLTQRYQAFKSGKFAVDATNYKTLAQDGQKPEVLVVSCVDSRVDPEAIFSAGPGELLVVRNIANIVPPFEEANKYQSVSSALEFAVLNLKVKHIVIMGHSGCGGIKVAMSDSNAIQTESRFISNWVSVLDAPKKSVMGAGSSTADDDIAAKFELAAIQASLNNLRSFPFVKAAEEAGNLNLHGCHFRIESGDLAVFDEQADRFSVL